MVSGVNKISTPPNRNHPEEHQRQEPLDLVAYSHLRWDYVWQRPQHLMSRTAKERRVFYVEEPIVEDEPSHLSVKRVLNGLWVATPYLSKDLKKEDARKVHIEQINQLFHENEIAEGIFWYYTPMAIAYTSHFHPSLVVYDCMDELANFHGASPKIKGYEKQLLERADLVFTGGYSLYESLRDRHSNVHPFPSSIDFAHFSQARKITEDPIDQMHIPHPRLGFFGVIDERLDLLLIEGIAAARPDWHLILIGPDAKVNKKRLPHNGNIHYLGPKAYRDLPEYLAGWDVALIPFAINPATEFISPTKTPEYLAGGKPVVSSPIRDIIKPYGEQKLVSIANGVDEFVEKIEAALSEPADRSKWLSRVDAFLSQNSWDYTWMQMMQLIESSLYNEPEAKSKMREDRKAPLHDSSIPSIPIQLGSEEKNGNRKGISIFDYLIVGAGFAGSVLAERLAAGSGKKVLLIDRRNHIGGNAYDTFNSEGLLIHQYGPHIFHTNSHEVFTFLSQFTDWRPYEHRVLASVDGQLLPIPINLDTINQLYGLRLSAFDLESFYHSIAEPRERILTSEDVVISKVGKELYEKFFRNYTRKQWDLDPSQLDASVTSRVPVRLNRDGRYFTDTYQAMPVYGYTRLFERMLDHPNIKIMLNTDYRDIDGLIPYREMIYTGPIDEYFDNVYGKLPYRSLIFKFETMNKPVYQPVAVINYPNEHLYTRVTEFKYLTGQDHPKTTLVYEYPSAEGDPYYPIPRPENAEIYQQYQKQAAATTGVHFVGRLATYKYYNMDQVVAQALTLYTKLAGIHREQAAIAHTSRYIPVELPGSKSIG